MPLEFCSGLIHGQLIFRKIEVVPKELIDKNNNNAVNYLATCAHYIHLNSVRAGLAKHLNQWRFSSYLDLAGLRNGTLCNKELFFMLSEIRKDEFIKESEAMLDFKRNAS